MRTFAQFCEALSPSEAVFGFASWLTSRKGLVKLGSHEEAGPVVELVGEFVEKQGLDEPREGWEKDLVPMKAEE